MDFTRPFPEVWARDELALERKKKRPPVLDPLAKVQVVSRVSFQSVQTSEVTVVFVTESRVGKVFVARLNDVLLIALNAAPNLLFPATADPKRHLVNEVDDDAASHSQHIVSSPGVWRLDQGLPARRRGRAGR